MSIILKLKSKISFNSFFNPICDFIIITPTHHFTRIMIQINARNSPIMIFNPIYIFFLHHIVNINTSIFRSSYKLGVIMTKFTLYSVLFRWMPYYNLIYIYIHIPLYSLNFSPTSLSTRVILLSRVLAIYVFLSWDKSKLWTDYFKSSVTNSPYLIS